MAESHDAEVRPDAPSASPVETPELPAFAGGLFVLLVVAGFVGVALAALLAGRLSGGLLSAFADPVVRSVLSFTLWQAFLSTLFSVGLALPVASALARQPDFPVGSG